MPRIDTIQNSSGIRDTTRAMKTLGRFVLALLFLSLGTAFGQDSGVKFVSMKGQVETRPDANRTGWKPAKLQTPIYILDHVKTQDEATAILSFADMSTFVLKPETEIVLETPPVRDSKIELITGKIWVNVKKIVQDGNMEIDMNQAVCGIKGTNITCSSGRSEDRVQVLRGTAEVMVRDNGARYLVNAGEEFIVRPGGNVQKVNIDVKKESGKWQKELSGLGDAFDLNEIPTYLRNLRQKEAEGFRQLSEKCKALTDGRNASDAEVNEFRKDAERFLGTLMEDSLALDALYARVAQAPGGNIMSPAASSLKMIMDVSNGLQKYQAEVARLLKAVVAHKNNPEVEELWREISQIFSEVREYVTGKPSEEGLSQVYYRNVVGQLERALQKMAPPAERLESIIHADSADRYAAKVSRQTSDYRNAIGRAIKNYFVVEIPDSTIIELQQADAEIGEIMHQLRRQVEGYNSAARHDAYSEARLLNSIAIVGRFSRARRIYRNCVRLYTSIMRSVKVIVTSEQRTFQDTYEHLTNTYQELGIVADQLQIRLRELEDQVETQIKR